MAHFRVIGWSSLSTLVLCALGLPGPVWAQDDDRIWGQVHTVSGDVHEGFIRWDRNEGSWVDILDGSKTIPDENYLAWLSATDVDADGPPVRTIDLLGYRISWNENDPEFSMNTASGVRFGHLSSLRVIQADTVELVLRSGEVVEFEGGSSDLGGSIRELLVEVPGGENVELEWSDLDRVVFSTVPPGTRAASPRLYGTVEDRDGNRYTGYVSWDLDEIFESDELDGEERRGGRDRSIRFGDIASIERVPGGSRVSLVDGGQLDLTDNRDVDRGNRGIQISDPALGMVEVEWREFRILRFHEAPAVVGYDAFDGGHPLVGTVVTELGEEIEGVIRWDADEAGSWEFLNGRADDVVFTVEFSYVSRIVRDGAFGSTVTLVDGRTFELDDSNDVGWDNKGILITPEGRRFANTVDGSRWRVIHWDEFDEVRFRHDANPTSGGRE